MGIFGFGKKKQKTPEELGDYYYRLSLKHDLDEWAYVDMAVGYGNRHAKVKKAQHLLDYYGTSLTKYMEEAARLLKEAESEGSLLDPLLASRVYCFGGYPEDACRFYPEAAESGDRWAQFQLAYAFDKGMHCEQNSERAVYWYTKAVEQGDTSAMCNLSLMYLRGRGVAKDTNKAKELMEKAAEKDNMTAVGNLAYDYYFGDDPCPQDFEKAAFYAKKGMGSLNKTTDQKCRYVTALLQTDGSGGVNEDLRHATREMQKLKDEGYKYADKGLKICEQRKYDVEVGFYQRALKNNDMELMKKAAYNGNVDAKCIMVKYRLEHFEEEIQKLEDHELGHFMYDYHKSMHLKDSVTREDIQPVVDLMEGMLVDYIRYGEFTSAYYIYEPIKEEASFLGQCLGAIATVPKILPYVNKQDKQKRLRELLKNPEVEGYEYLKPYMEFVLKLLDEDRIDPWFEYAKKNSERYRRIDRTGLDESIAKEDLDKLYAEASKNNDVKMLDKIARHGHFQSCHTLIGIYGFLAINDMQLPEEKLQNVMTYYHLCQFQHQKVEPIFMIAISSCIAQYINKHQQELLADNEIYQKVFDLTYYVRALKDLNVAAALALGSMGCLPASEAKQLEMEATKMASL